MKKIGLLGFDFKSPNLGCEALSYSFFNMLSEVCNDSVEAHVFAYANPSEFPINSQKVRLVWHKLHLKSPSFILSMKSLFDSFDCIWVFGYLWKTVEYKYRYC